MVMETLSWQSHLAFFCLAAGMGAVGGFTFELLQQRGGSRDSSGRLERVRRVGRDYVDLGAWASVIIGAIAALVAMWVFPPAQMLTVVENGIERQSGARYDIVKIVGLSLVVGSAGSTFLAAVQTRALALVQMQQAEAARCMTVEELDMLAHHADQGASPKHIARVIRDARARIAAAGRPAAEHEGVGPRRPRTARQPSS